MPVERRRTINSLLGSSNLDNSENANLYEVIGAILHSESRYSSLLSKEGDEAQTILNALQRVLDTPAVPEELRRAVIYAIMRLSGKTGLFPECLILPGVERNGLPVASGGFGDVWKGTYNSQPVCIKATRLDKQSDIHLKSFAREATLWSHLDHPNILQFLGICHMKDPYGRVCPSIISPWMSNGNVNDYIAANTEVPRLPLVLDALKGLQYLHDHKVVHGDLKSYNILITPDGSACLADFGLSSIADEDILRWSSLESVIHTGGTMQWEAPELLDDSNGGQPRPTFTCDIYSFASVMYEILTGHIPYYEIRREAAVLAAIIVGRMPSKPSIDEALELTPEIWELMEKCWDRDSDKRPAAADMLETLHKIAPSSLTQRRISLQRLHSNTSAKRTRSSSINKFTPDISRSVGHVRSACFSDVERSLLLGLNEDNLPIMTQPGKVPETPDNSSKSNAVNLHEATSIEPSSKHVDHQPVVDHIIHQSTAPALPQEAETVKRLADQIVESCTEFSSDEARVVGAKSLQLAIASELLKYGVPRKQKVQVNKVLEKTRRRTRERRGSLMQLFAQRGLAKLQQTIARPPPVKVLDGEVSLVGESAIRCGRYCDIWKGIWLGEKKVALKAIRPIKARDEAAQAQFVHEIDVWSKLSNDHILQFYGIVTDVDSSLLIMSSWLENGSALDYLAMNPKADKLSLLQDAAEGLNYLHSQDVVHGNSE
ncbi:hypothetical protein AN958_05288 [Leucoagaricus sp. SymC.cos]|nr:hypothetical protein AN958_05288 [Leucoagaricus sp. SymC.cos]